MISNTFTCGHVQGGSFLNGGLFYCAKSSHSHSSHNCEDKCTYLSNCIGYAEGYFRGVRGDEWVYYGKGACYLYPTVKQCPPGFKPAYSAYGEYHVATNGNDLTELRGYPWGRYTCKSKKGIISLKR